jgi:hypothetical protein
MKHLKKSIAVIIMVILYLAGRYGGNITLFYDLVKEGNISKVTEFLNSSWLPRIYVNVVENGDTPLHFAAKHGYVE